MCYYKDVRMTPGEPYSGFYTGKTQDPGAVCEFPTSFFSTSRSRGCSGAFTVAISTQTKTLLANFVPPAD